MNILADKERETAIRVLKIRREMYRNDRYRASLLDAAIHCLIKGRSASHILQMERERNLV